VVIGLHPALLEELRVVDDNEEGSADQLRTARCMHRFRRDTRVTYVVDGDSKGAAAARNVGMRGSRGEVLAFLDGRLPGNATRAERRAQELDALATTLESIGSDGGLADAGADRLHWLAGLGLDTDDAPDAVEAIRRLAAATGASTTDRED
jgi:glycosyltransferase involved in cell wall biosynthesis